MMQMCVDCGAEVDALIDGSCSSCFLEKTELMTVPIFLDIELCAHCDARRVGKGWVDPMQGMELPFIREDAVREAVRVHLRVREPFLQYDERMMDERNFQYTIVLEGLVEELQVNQSKTLTVRQRRGVCDRCSRMYGNYYAAIIQLRATEREVTKEELERAHKLVGDELDRQRASGNRFSFLTKSGPEHGGFDYYLGDIESARQVSRMLCKRLDAVVTENAKLVGRREGDDVYRVTFLVRIKLFSIGDFAQDGEGRIMQIISPNMGRMQVVDLEKQFKTRIQQDRLKRVGGLSDVVHVIVVSHTENEVQILHPKTYQTIDIKRTPIMVPENGQVSVFFHEEVVHGAWWLPTALLYSDDTNEGQE